MGSLLLGLPEEEKWRMRCWALLPGIQWQDVWEWSKATLQGSDGALGSISLPRGGWTLNGLPREVGSALDKMPQLLLSLECQALGPGDHCSSLTAELFCSSWFLFWVGTSFFQLLPLQSVLKTREMHISLCSLSTLYSLSSSVMEKPLGPFFCVSDSRVLPLYSFCFRSNPGFCFWISLKIPVAYSGSCHDLPASESKAFSILMASRNLKKNLFFYPVASQLCAPAF